jgi:hypothetical protein
MNERLKSLVGKPHNLSSGECGRKTHAETRPMVNSSISSGKFLPGASRYGVDGVGKK